MQRFLNSLHLYYVGLGFSTQKEIRIRSEYGSFYVEAFEDEISINSIHDYYRNGND